MSGFQKIAYIPLLFFWLFFLPNTAYLLTMVRHLLDHCADYDRYRVCAEEGWMVPFFFGYGILAIPTFWYALKTMVKTLKKLVSPKIDPLFPVIIIPVTAFGVMLGLFPRLNSWQIVSDPLVILKISLDYLTDLTMLLNLLAYTIVLGMIYYGIEWIRQKGASEDRDHRLQ